MRFDARLARLHDDQPTTDATTSGRGDEPQLHAGEEQGAEHDRDEDDRGAEVATEEHEADATPATGTIGSATWRQSWRRSPLGASTKASQMTSASLISSEGWAVNEPMLIQLRLQPCRSRGRGTRAAAATIATTTRATPSASRTTAGARAAMQHERDADQRVQPLARRREEVAVLTRDSIDDDDSTMTRPKTTRKSVVPSSRKYSGVSAAKMRADRDTTAAAGRAWPLRRSGSGGGVGPAGGEPRRRHGAPPSLVRTAAANRRPRSA